jgi:MFS family permease
MTTASYVEAAQAAADRRAALGRSLAMLVTGAAMMQAATMVASTAGILMFAAAFGDRWGGVPGTAGVLGVAAGVLGLTRVMGRSGRRRGLILAYCVGAAGAGLALTGVLAGPMLVVAGLFLLGVGNAGSQLARYAGAELYPASRRGLAVGAVVWAGTIGAVGGPALLAVPASVDDRLGLPPLTGAFLLALLAAGAAGAATLGVRGPAGPPPDRGRQVTPSRLLARPSVRVVVIAQIVAQMVMVALMIAAPLQVHHHGHGLAAVGVVISVHVLGMYALAPLTGHLTDRFGGGPVLLAGLLAVGGSACALIASARLSGPEFAVGLFILGFGWNLSMVGGSALLISEVPEPSQLRAQGAVEASVWSSSAVASFFSTHLFALGGYRLVATASAALVVAALLAIGPLRGPLRPGSSVAGHTREEAAQ